MPSPVGGIVPGEPVVPAYRPFVGLTRLMPPLPAARQSGPTSGPAVLAPSCRGSPVKVFVQSSKEKSGTVTGAAVAIPPAAPAISKAAAMRRINDLSFIRLGWLFELVIELSARRAADESLLIRV